MKRRYTTFVGNILMATGVILMAGGILVLVLSYLPELSLSTLLSQSSLTALFFGAFLWLIGAWFCGRDRIEDRYWYMRREARMRMKRSDLYDS